LEEKLLEYLPHIGLSTKAIGLVLIQQKKYVVSNTLNMKGVIRFINSNVVEEKQQNGPDLQVHGSGNLIQTLLKNYLVDEFWLKIVPVTLGEGKKVFEWYYSCLI
jgi:dihydrofolate reductase